MRGTALSAVDGHASTSRIENMSSQIDPKARYLKSHEWARIDGNLIVCGISDHAQEAMSDLVFAEVPRVGAKFKAGDIFGVVESVKAASDVYIPIGGTIVEANTALETSPESINKDPYGAGWMIKVRPDNPDDFQKLMDSAEYEKHLQTEEH